MRPAPISTVSSVSTIRTTIASVIEIWAEWWAERCEAVSRATRSCSSALVTARIASTRCLPASVTA